MPRVFGSKGVIWIDDQGGVCRNLSGDFNSITFNTGSATEVTGVLDEMYAGSVQTRIQYLPAGSIAGSPIYTASMRLTSLAINQPVDNLVTANFSLALAAGSVTQACIT